MTLLIAVGGMLVLAGLALGIALAVGVQMPAREPAPADGRRSWLSRHWRELLVAVPVGVVAMLATGWVAAGFGAAAVVLLAPTLLRPSAALKQHIARLQALSSWTRRLSDLLGSGAAQTLQDAITRGRRGQPAGDRQGDSGAGLPDGTAGGGAGAAAVRQGDLRPGRRPRRDGVDRAEPARGSGPGRRAGPAGRRRRRAGADAPRHPGRAVQADQQPARHPGASPSAPGCC